MFMEKLKLQLRQYVADHPPDYGDGDCHSILDMLYYRFILPEQSIRVPRANAHQYDRSQG